MAGLPGLWGWAVVGDWVSKGVPKRLHGFVVASVVVVAVHTFRQLTAGVSDFDIDDFEVNVPVLQPWIVERLS